MPHEYDPQNETSRPIRNKIVAGAQWVGYATNYSLRLVPWYVMGGGIVGAVTGEIYPGIVNGNETDSTKLLPEFPLIGAEFAAAGGVVIGLINAGFLATAAISHPEERTFVPGVWDVGRDIVRRSAQTLRFLPSDFASGGGWEEVQETLGLHVHPKFLIKRIGEFLGIGTITAASNLFTQESLEPYQYSHIPILGESLLFAEGKVVGGWIVGRVGLAFLSTINRGRRERMTEERHISALELLYVLEEAAPEIEADSARVIEDINQHRDTKTYE